MWVAPPMLVAVATGSNPAAGSATVARAAALQSLPATAAAYTAGALSTTHVAVILDAAGHLPRFGDYEHAVAAAGDDRTPKQRRADALADLVTAACANTRTLGTSGLSVLVDLDDLPEATGATSTTAPRSARTPST